MARKPAATKVTTPVVEVAPIKERAVGGGLEGAERTSRETFQWDAAIISPDRQINPVKETADARSRDSVQNDGYAMGAVSTHRDSIVGAQYRLNAQPDYKAIGADEGWAEEFQDTIESRFNLLSDSEKNWLDASRMNTLTGLVRLAVGGYLMTGEVLSTVEWIRYPSYRPWGTAIQFVSPSRLSNPNGLSDTKYLRRGVRKDKFGVPISYAFQVAHPTDWFLDPNAMVWREVPAEKPWGRKQVIHIIEQLQPDQTRGIADMVSVLKQMRMTKQFQEVVLQNAVVNASYAAAIESELPTDVVYQSLGAGQAGFSAMLGQYMEALGAYTSGAKNLSIDGVKLPHLFPGTKLNMKPMGNPGGVGSDFEQSLLRHTAAALGLSYEQFSKDYTQTNYSSARASMNETWKYMQGRKKAVADRFANNVYALTLEEDLNAGLVPLPKGRKASDFYTDPVFREALLCCTWIGSSRGQIDELKETQAAVMRIKSGLSTYEIETARLGIDFRRLFAQAAREKRLMVKLGLDFNLDAAEPGANDAKKTMDESGTTKSKAEA